MCLSAYGIVVGEFVCVCQHLLTLKNTASNTGIKASIELLGFLYFEEAVLVSEGGIPMLY